MYPSKKLSEIIVLNYWKAVDKSDKSDDGLYDVYGANGVMYKSKRFNFDGESIIVWRKWSAWAINRVSGKFWTSDVTYYVTTNQNVDYICYILKKLNLPELAKWVKPGINRNDVYEIEIPLPPLSTQSRIVARLDSAFASIDEQISLLRANIADVENMRKSVLEESFQSGEYELRKFWDIFDVRDGTHDSPRFHTTGYPLITSKNLSENGIDFWNIKLISEEDYEKINQRSKVDKWDLLFAMIGTIGTPTIVDIESEFAIKNVALFKPKNTDADMRYLRYFLLSDFVIQKMLSESKWATQKFVGLGYLRAFQIPLPSLPRQHEIVAHLDRVFGETESLRGEYEAQIQDLGTLKQSLLEEAFVGRLVTDEV